MARSLLRSIEGSSDTGAAGVGWLCGAGDGRARLLVRGLVGQVGLRWIEGSVFDECVRWVRPSRALVREGAVRCGLCAGLVGMGEIDGHALAGGLGAMEWSWS